MDIFTADKEVKQIQEKDLHTKKHKYVWIDIEHPTEKALKHIAPLVNLHPVTVEDCINQNVRIKNEEFPNYLFLVVRSIRSLKSARHIHAAQLSIIITKNVLITIHHSKIDTITEVKESEKTKALLKKGPAYLLHHILDIEVDKIFPILTTLDNKIAAIEAKLFHAQDHILNEIFQIRRELHALRRRIIPMREVINVLTKSPFLGEELHAYFRDVYDHMVRITTTIDSYRELIANNLEVYLGVVSNRMNDVMKILTIIATIMMPLTLITGIYGMNFQVMPELLHPYGYFIVLGVMLLIALIMLYFFKRKKWI